MSETIFLIQYPVEEQNQRSFKYASVVKIYRVLPNDERISLIKKQKDQWTDVREEIENSDDDSDFDEKLLPRQSKYEPYHEFEELEEIGNRMIKVLCAWMKEKGVEKHESLAPIEEGQEFDLTSERDLNQLLCRFKQHFPHYETPEQVPKDQLVTKYKTTYNFTAILHKNAEFADVKDIYVVFMSNFGCCSSSDRCRRIYSTLEKATNYANKLYNAAQVEYDPDGCFQSGESNTPKVCKFSWSIEKNCFVYVWDVGTY